MLLLHPEIGEYSSIKHPQLNFKEGERIDFFCPICLQSLDAAMDENLVHVIMTDAQHIEHEVYFSRITGERSTYKSSEQNVMKTGEHSHRYSRFMMSDDSIQYLQS